MPNSKIRPTVKVRRRLEKLIPKFLEYQKQNLENLNKSLETGNLREIARTGHIIKGAAGSYGFDEMTTLGNAIELAAQAQDLEKLKQEIAKYKDYLENLEIVFE